MLHITSNNFLVCEILVKFLDRLRCPTRAQEKAGPTLKLILVARYSEIKQSTAKRFNSGKIKDLGWIKSKIIMYMRNRYQN